MLDTAMLSWQNYIVGISLSASHTCNTATCNAYIVSIYHKALRMLPFST